MLTIEQLRHRVDQLHEANPMLGHRGCRLCITYPEILEMQVRAIIEAAVNCTERGVKVLPEIMIPLSIDAKELALLVAQTRAVADAILKVRKSKLPYLVGTMIETPRAALLSQPMAESAEFFSFGTNDLTQLTMGLSRDDAGKFLPEYLSERSPGGEPSDSARDAHSEPSASARDGASPSHEAAASALGGTGPARLALPTASGPIFTADPFQSLDTDGVGFLVRMSCEQGREGRTNIKLGICGEHGGDPQSIRFCEAVGLDYVSCSPLRVPIARLAAAQAAIEQGVAPRKSQAVKRTSPRTIQRKLAAKPKPASSARKIPATPTKTAKRRLPARKGQLVGARR
jgi:pyruvate,orthophosphate dikinase